MARKEEHEFVMLEDVPLMIRDFTKVSEDFGIATKGASDHLKILHEKHDSVSQAQLLAGEISKLIRKYGVQSIRDKYGDAPLIRFALFWDLMFLKGYGNLNAVF